MKRGKKPTLAQKIRLKKFKLDLKNWLVTKDCQGCFGIVNRESGKMRKFELASIGGRSH